MWKIRGLAVLGLGLIPLAIFALTVQPSQSIQSVTHLTGLIYNIQPSPGSAFSLAQCKKTPQTLSYSATNLNSLSEQNYYENILTKQGAYISEQTLSMLNDHQGLSLGVLPGEYHIDGKTYKMTMAFALTGSEDGSYYAKGKWQNQYCQGEVIFVTDQQINPSFSPAKKTVQAPKWSKQL